MLAIHVGGKLLHVFVHHNLAQRPIQSDQDRKASTVQQKSKGYKKVFVDIPADESQMAIPPKNPGSSEAIKVKRKIT